MKAFNLAILFLISSCAVIHKKNGFKKTTFESHHLEFDGVVAVDVTHRYMLANGDIDHTLKYSPYVLSSPKEVKSFNLCKPQGCRSDAARTILIDIYYGTSHNIMSLFSGMTLTLIPARELEHFKAIALVLDEEKRIVGKYFLEDEIATWVQLFLVFGLPFQDFNASDKAMRVLVDEVLWRAKSDGLI